MAFRVLHDANAIFGALQRSILVRVGEKQTSFHLRVLLTEEILTEMVQAVSARYPDFDDRQAAGLKTAMIEAIPDSLVTGYQYGVDAIDIADPDDRHVVAAAIHGRAQIIVTGDRHFDWWDLGGEGLGDPDYVDNDPWDFWPIFHSQSSHLFPFG
ncbi:MAG: PIN domain-containing protein [Acidimicrobiia bacterium]